MIKDETRRGRPRKDENWSHELLSERSERYFSKCDSRVKEVLTKEGIVQMANPAPYSIEGLCCYLDVSRDTFTDWLKMPDDIGDAARRAYLQILANQVESGIDGKSAALTQFILKNTAPQYYQDKSETQVGMDQSLSELFGGLGWKGKNLNN